MPIVIYLNGKSEEIKNNLNISKLLEAKKIRPEVVTIELNDKIIEKDNYGNTIRQVPSKLGDNYVIVDTKKDLSELDRDEYKAIIAQNDFSNYKRTSTYAGKFGKVYGWTSTGVKYGKYALAFL